MPKVVKVAGSRQSYGDNKKECHYLWLTVCICRLQVEYREFPVIISATPGGLTQTISTHFVRVQATLLIKPEFLPCFHSSCSLMKKKCFDIFLRAKLVIALERWIKIYGYLQSSLRRQISRGNNKFCCCLSIALSVHSVWLQFGSGLTWRNS